MATQARVAGTVKIDGVAAARDVIVIKDDPAGRQVVADGQSAADGTFDITYNDWSGAVVVLALDEYGDEFATETALNMGQVVHPATPNGYVYKVTAAGTTGTESPAWPTTGSVQSGGVTFAALPYYRPVASGPLQGQITQFVYFEQYLIDSSPSAAWLFNEGAGAVIESISGSGSAFPDGAGVTREAEALPENADVGQFSYSFDGSDSAYLQMGYDDSFLQSPLFSLCVAFQLPDYQAPALTIIAGTAFAAAQPGFSLAYDNRQIAGSSLETTTRAIRFYASNGSRNKSINAFKMNAIDDSRPHFLSVVYDGSVVKIFIDGAIVSDTTPMTSPLPTSESSLLIGNSKDGSGLPLAGSCMKGALDTLAIWDGVALTDQEVADLAAKFFASGPSA